VDRNDVDANVTVRLGHGRCWRVPGETTIPARTAVSAQAAGDGSGVGSLRNPEVDLVDAKHEHALCKTARALYPAAYTSGAAVAEQNVRDAGCSTVHGKCRTGELKACVSYLHDCTLRSSEMQVSGRPTIGILGAGWPFFKGRQNRTRN